MPDSRSRVDLRVIGIEPTFTAWEAVVLPLDDTRIVALKTDDARPTSILGELAFGVPLEHFETWALADPGGSKFDGRTSASRLGGFRSAIELRPRSLPKTDDARPTPILGELAFGVP